jgi:hypothetical protein
MSAEHAAKVHLWKGWTYCSHRQLVADWDTDSMQGAQKSRFRALALLETGPFLHLFLLHNVGQEL